MRPVMLMQVCQKFQYNLFVTRVTITTSYFKMLQYLVLSESTGVLISP